MQKGENIPVIHIHVNTPPADLEKWFIFYFFHVLAFHGGGSINIYVVHGGGSINIYVVHGGGSINIYVVHGGGSINIYVVHGGGSINIYVVHGGGSINIYVVGVLFGGSNFSLSGCSHVGSLFTDEKQKKGWLVM